MVHELFIDPMILASMMQPGAPGLSLDGSMMVHAPSVGAGGQRQSLPFHTLTTLGVQPETVRQLTEMKQYLSRHFGLDLSIFREQPFGEDSWQPQITQDWQLARGMSAGGGHHVVSHQQKPPSPDELVFTVPKMTVGGIIGKSGMILKDLQTEFGVKLYVEKEDYQSNSGLRQVVISGPDRDAMMRCKDKVLSLVEMQAREQATSMGSGP